MYHKRGRFAELSLHGFHPIKLFTEKHLQCLTFITLNAIVRSLYKYSQENFFGTLENCEKDRNLAQQIFPCLQYVYDLLCRDIITHHTDSYSYWHVGSYVHLFMVVV